MVQLSLKIVVTYPAKSTYKDKFNEHPTEDVLWVFDANQFDPDCFNKIISEGLISTRNALGMNALNDLTKVSPEIAISLFANEGECRPAFHLDAKTIALMSEAGASFDFDPYV